MRRGEGREGEEGRGGALILRYSALFCLVCGIGIYWGCRYMCDPLSEDTDVLCIYIHYCLAVT